jgi:hypothetical protein
MEYTVTATWDVDTAVWIATSEDVPGLVLESGSLDALMERVRTTVPELLALNKSDSPAISILFKSERHDKVYA